MLTPDKVEQKAKEALGNLSLDDHLTHWQPEHPDIQPFTTRKPLANAQNHQCFYTPRTPKTSNHKYRIKNNKKSHSHFKTLLVPKKIKF